MEKQDINQSMRSIDPQEAVDFILKNASRYAEAHSQRVYLENMTKVIKSKLIQDCKNEPTSRAEAYAVSHPDYKVNIEGIKAAMFEEDKLRWFLEAAKLRAEIWRTQEASNRNIDKAAR